jgi:hypothetical protein
MKMIEVQPVGAAVDDEKAAEEKLAARLKAGASWFYWIAGLSLVNTVIHLSGADWQFVLGLGITLLFDALAMGLANEPGSGGTALAAKIVAVVIGLVAAAVFILFGWLANRRKGWAFVVGMVLYLLDGLIFLFVTDWLALAFHAFALFAVFSGYSACRSLAALEKRSAYAPIAP